MVEDLAEEGRSGKCLGEIPGQPIWGDLELADARDHGEGSMTSSLPPLKWVDWFNHRGIHHDLGRIPPAELDDQHYDQINSGHRANAQTKTPA